MTLTMQMMQTTLMTLMTLMINVFIFVHVDTQIGIVFVLVCLYCFVSTALKSVTGRDVLPFGKPVLQVSFLHSQGPSALWADARRATGVKAIAGTS